MNEFARIQDVVKFRLDHYLMILAEWVGINSYTLNKEGVAHLAGSTFNVFLRHLPDFRGEIIPSKINGRGPHMRLFKDSACGEESLDSQGKKTIFMVSHLDTVYKVEEEIENDFHFRIEGGYVYGPGVVDIKGGTLVALASLVVLAQLYPEVYRQLSFEVLLNGSEEILGNDDFMDVVTKAHDNRRKSDCYGLVFEEQDKGFGLIAGRKGVGVYKAKITGISGHSGANHAACTNSLRIAANLIEELERLTVYPDLTVNVSVIRNPNHAFNRVPDYTELDFEMRHYNRQEFLDVHQKILSFRDYVPSFVRSGMKHINIEQIFRLEPWAIDPANAVFAIFKDALSPYVQLKAGTRGGGSDANRLAPLMPTIDGLGPRGGHCHNSKLLIEDGELIAEPEKMEIDSILSSVAITVMGILGIYRR